MSLSLRKLAELLQLEFRGDGEIEIDGVASLEKAGETDLSFIQHQQYLPGLENSRCGALIVTAELVDGGTGAVLAPVEVGLGNYSTVAAVPAKMPRNCAMNWRRGFAPSR